MQTFNQNRLHIVAEHYLKNSDKVVLSPKEANIKEPVLTTVQRHFNKIDLGARLSKAHGLTQFQIGQLENEESNYCLGFNMKSNNRNELYLLERF